MRVRSNRAKFAALGAAAALAFSMAGCASGNNKSDDPATSEPETVTETVTESESATDTETETETETQSEDTSSEGSDADHEAVANNHGDAGSRSSYKVMAEEYHGKTLLRYDDDLDGDKITVEGKFIVGPGGCFSLTRHDDRPYLLVFDDDTQMIKQNKPGIITDGKEIHVGDRVSFKTRSIPQDIVDGIPAQCMQGGHVAILEIDD